MGAVSIDIHKAERDFYNLNLSDVDVVKWLIMHRDKVDIYFGAKTDNQFDVAGHVQKVNQELIHLYAYLDELIKWCKFSEGQLQLIHLISIGYTFKDVEDVYGETTAQNVKRRFITICKSISQMNNEIWSLWVSNAVLKEQSKACSTCEKSLPLKEKYFRKQEDCKDGFRPVCRKCEKSAKRQLK